ncbi:MAG TPA: xanthine dehydrogenase family protein molybdopterin-binding subunit, partial [Mycobacterium sp.]|nr:xanthine dehydrogenase family protein molybdopterin-binding subunit [Mycobacterium sp.]
VYTAADLAAAGLKPLKPMAPFMNQAMQQPLLAGDTVRYVGEPVAAVVTEEIYQGEDAIELVDVDYDFLPAVVDMNDALAGDKGLLFADAKTNVVCTFGDASAADPDLFAGCEVVTSQVIQNTRVAPAPMESRSAAAAWGEDGRLTAWIPNQGAQGTKGAIAGALGVKPEDVRIITPDVGGAFGAKFGADPEHSVTCWIARELGRPVRWSETRMENLLAMPHGRAQQQKITIGGMKDGTVLAYRIEILQDCGAYPKAGAFLPSLTRLMTPGPYNIPRAESWSWSVVTNTTPVGAYRGAGRPEATFAIERMMDELAAELGRDPLELRAQNWITHDEFPFDTVAGLTYDSGNYEAATAQARELFDYTGLRREQGERRDRNDPVQLGIGVSTFTEMCGLAPSRVLGSLSYGAGGWEHAAIRMLPTGKVEVVTGSSPHGQGHETAWSQIVADQLGVPFEDVEIIHGDTQSSPRGLDTYGSRSLAVGAIAVVKAADKVIAKAKPFAAHMMECAEDDLEFTEGRFRVTGTEKAVTLAEIALAVFAAHDLPDGLEPSLDSEATYDPENFSFPHGTHLCATEVDTETGQVRIRSYVCVDDIGHVVNPLIVDGQVHGGLAQGIAQALYEEAVHDESGTLINASFSEYLVPSAADLPSFVTGRTETPATTNPLGVKGVGEAGTIASTPAVVNAVIDAVRHLGVKDIEMPCSPMRVWHAINAGAGRPATSNEGGAR